MLKKVLMSVCCFCVPFLCASCGLSTSTDGGSLDALDLIKSVSTVSIADGSETYEQVETMVTELSSSILDNLYSEYGANSLTANFRDEVEDTHKNAIWQDNWLFSGKQTYTNPLLKDEWVNEDVDKVDYSLILKYNIYQILLGKQILDIQVSNLGSINEYTSIKNTLLTAENFNRFAREISHTGLFYYEVDAIAEYILNYIIGQTAVSIDNQKFDDINENGTFDYLETINSVAGVGGAISFPYPIIKNYQFDKKRATETQKSEVWSKIEFGINLGLLDIPDNLSVENEVPFSIEYLKNNNIANKYYLGVEEYFSGFKNYVNMAYFIAYKSAQDALSEEKIANVQLEELPTIMASYTEGIPGLSNEYKVEAKEYHSLIIKAKEDVSISSLWMFIALDESVNESVDFQIDATYYRCEDASKHEHSETCSFKKTTGNIAMQTVVPKVDDESNGNIYADFSILEEGGYGYYVTDFAKQGIYSLDLTEYINDEGEEDKIVVCESDELIGCDFTNSNVLNDYIQITFKVLSQHTMPIKFKFYFLW